MGRRGWDTISPQTPPLAHQPTLERELTTLSIFLSKGFAPYMWHPNFQNLYVRDQLPKHLALKANRAHAHETYKAIANWEVSLEELTHVDSPWLYSMARCTGWVKCPVFLWKMPICLTWSFSLKGRNSIELQLAANWHTLQRPRLPSWALPPPHSSSPISPGKEPVYMCGTLAFVATAQGSPLDRVALMASGAHVPRFHRIVINREIVPNRQPCSPQPPPRAQWRGSRQTPSLSMKEAY